MVDSQASGAIPAATASGVADVFAPNCPSRATLEHICGRWGFLTVAALARQPRRFSELRRQIGGVSEKMLSQTLQSLERDGLVHRDVQSAFPPRVEYSLTPLGRRVAEHVAGLIDLVEQEIAAVVRARSRYDNTVRA